MTHSPDRNRSRSTRPTETKGQRDNRPQRGNERGRRLKPAAKQRAAGRKAGLQPGQVGYPAPTNGERTTVLTGKYAGGNGRGLVVMESQVQRQRLAGTANGELPGNHRQRRDAARRAAQDPQDRHQSTSRAAVNKAFAQQNPPRDRGGFGGLLSALLGGSADRARGVGKRARKVTPKQMGQAHARVAKAVSTFSGHLEANGGASANDILNAGAKTIVEVLDGATRQPTPNHRGRVRARYARGKAGRAVRKEMRGDADKAAKTAVADARGRGITDRGQLDQIARQARYNTGRDDANYAGNRRQKLVHKHAHSVRGKAAGHVGGVWGFLTGAKRKVDTTIADAGVSHVHGRIDQALPPTSASNRGRRGRNQTPQGKAHH